MISILDKLLGKTDSHEEEEEGYIIEKIPESAEIVERYWIKKPFARVTIARLPEKGGAIKYFAEEVPLRPNEKKLLNKIVNIVTSEIDPTKFTEENVDIREALVRDAEKILKKYEKKFKIRGKDSKQRLLYYIERELIGFGPLDVLMRDVEIEDISCDGINSSVYIWHRKYESIPTNIIFTDKSFLDNFIVKLAHRAGKHVSSAFPIVDAMIYGKHRLAASFREEVSPKGSTFTIRKFREEPYSVIDLIELGTISPDMAAYFWVLMEGKMSMLIIGGTGAGKTTLLNALATLIKPGYKIVTVEETAEINLPVENWVQFISRESYGISGVSVGQITLFDLVKTSLRYRPDYLIVGEVRGEEAFVLFQAVATGHGGLCTIHGESLDAAIKRLTSPPMNVSESYIPLMNVAIKVDRVALPKEKHRTPFGRRVTTVWEIRDFEDYLPIFEWSPSEDIFYSYLDRSVLIPRLAARLGVSVEDILREMEIRSKLLTWLKEHNIRAFREVFKYINEYYTNRERILELIGEKEKKKVPVLVQPEDKIEDKIIEIDLEETTKALIPLPDEVLKQDIFKKIYEILEFLVNKNKSVRTDYLMKKLGLDEFEFNKLLEVLKKQRLVSVEEKKKYTYIRIKRKGKRTYYTLSRRFAI